MATISVIKTQNLSSFVLAAAFRFASDAAERLASLLRPLLREGEELPDIEFFQVLVGRWLERDREELIDAEDEHLEELEATTETREARDDAAKKLYKVLLETRRALEGIFGLGKSRKIARLKAGIPIEPVPLQRWGRRAVKRMTAPGFRFPKPVIPGAAPKPEVVVARILPSLEELEALLAQLDPELRDSTRSQRVRTEKLNQHDALVGQAARMLGGLYELAKLKFYKERLRPSTHAQRPAGEAEGEPAEVGDQPVPAANDDGETENVEASPFEEGAEVIPADAVE